MEGMRAEDVLDRDVLFTRNRLAKMLDEFHPSSRIFSATVKRLVRRLVVLEEALGM